MAFELYTDRAARVVVFSAQEAAVNGATKIGNEHALIALARDAATRWPKTDAAESARSARLPLSEDTPLAMKVLEHLGVDAQTLVAEVCRVGGLIAPDPLSSPSPVADGDIATVVNAAKRRAVFREIAYAKRRHGNHISTLHQLLAICRTGDSPVHEVLTSLGVSLRDVKGASSVVEEEIVRMSRQMLVLALDNERLRTELAAVFPGSTNRASWKRRGLSRP